MITLYCLQQKMEEKNFMKKTHQSIYLNHMCIRWVPTKPGPPIWTPNLDPNLDPLMDPIMDPLAMA